MKKNKYVFLCTYTLLVFFFFRVQAQHNKSSFDKIKECFTFYPNKKRATQDSLLYLSKIIAAPVISYAPETSLGLGVGSKYLFKFSGSSDETRTSNLPMLAVYTFNKQFILYSGFEVFTNQENYVLTGNFLFQNFPRLYYGIGYDTPKSNEEIYDSSQVLFEPIFLKRMFTRYLFLGAGFRYNHIFNVTTIDNGLLENTQPLGFRGTTSFGGALAALYDSRDNILNASKGIYFHFTHGFYGKLLGGINHFQLTKFDFRYFKSLTKDAKNIIGYHLIGHFTNGDTPLSEMAFLGGSNIMRGYTEGRYIERNLIATQVEYRKQIKGSRLGIVTFAGLGAVANDFGAFRLDQVRPNAGAGIRFLLDSDENLNIRFDWGAGHKTNSKYLNLAEAF